MLKTRLKVTKDKTEKDEKKIVDEYIDEHV